MGDNFRIKRQLLISAKEEDINTSYIFEGELGKGAYGTVKLATHILTG
jgi:hypothetical protein